MRVYTVTAPDMEFNMVFGTAHIKSIINIGIAMESKSVGILGSGAWGTGLAQALARGNHRIRMWAREADVAESVNNDHENKRYLTGLSLIHI